MALATKLQHIMGKMPLLSDLRYIKIGLEETIKVEIAFREKIYNFQKYHRRPINY